MHDTDYDGFTRLERLLAERRGLSVEDTASAIARDDMRALFHDAGRVSPRAAKAMLDGWKLAWQIRDRNDSRQRLADIKAKAAAKLPPKKPRPTPRRPLRPWMGD